MDIADALTDREPDFRIPDNGNTPAPDAAPTQPWLSTAGRGTFNPDGVDEDFICKAVIAYWEIVPGGQKWVEMIESYLGLAKCSLAKGVSNWYHVFLIMTNSQRSSNLNAFRRSFGLRKSKYG